MLSIAGKSRPRLFKPRAAGPGGAGNQEKPGYVRMSALTRQRGGSFLGCHPFAHEGFPGAAGTPSESNRIRRALPQEGRRPIGGKDGRAGASCSSRYSRIAHRRCGAVDRFQPTSGVRAKRESLSSPRCELQSGGPTRLHPRSAARRSARERTSAPRVVGSLHGLLYSTRRGLPTAGVLTAGPQARYFAMENSYASRSHCISSPSISSSRWIST